MVRQLNINPEIFNLRDILSQIKNHLTNQPTRAEVSHHLHHLSDKFNFSYPLYCEILKKTNFSIEESVKIVHQEELKQVMKLLKQKNDWFNSEWVIWLIIGKYLFKYFAAAEQLSRPLGLPPIKSLRWVAHYNFNKTTSFNIYYV